MASSTAPSIATDGTGTFYYPGASQPTRRGASTATDALGDVYVADGGNDRIQKVKPTG